MLLKTSEHVVCLAKSNGRFNGKINCTEDKKNIVLPNKKKKRKLKKRGFGVLTVNTSFDNNIIMQYTM